MGVAFKMDKVKLYISRIFILFHTNLIKTIWFNFKQFPLKIAIRFPILLYGEIETKGYEYGKIIFTNEKPHFGGWKIGINQDFLQGDANNPERTRFIIEGTLILGEYGRLGNGVFVRVKKGGILTLGNQVGINYRTKIACFQNITLEDRVRVSWECQIFDTDFHYLFNRNGEIRNCTSPIVIGQESWIGNRVTIGKGVQLERRTTVASNSLVNKKFIGEEGVIIAGCPAKIVKKGFFRLYNLSQEEALLEYFNTSKEDVIKDDMIDKIVKCQK